MELLAAAVAITALPASVVRRFGIHILSAQGADRREVTRGGGRSRELDGHNEMLRYR